MAAGGTGGVSGSTAIAAGAGEADVGVTSADVGVTSAVAVGAVAGVAALAFDSGPVLV